MQKEDLSSVEQDEFAATNSRLVELLTSIEQLETEIHHVYLSQTDKPK